MLGTVQHRSSRQTQFQIIKSWLLPKLLYGIEIVSWKRENFKKQIAPLYHTAIRCATEAFVMSPIASLLCESELHSLDHIITDKTVATAGRMMGKTIKTVVLNQRAKTDFTTLTQQTLPSVPNSSKSVVVPGTAAHHK